MERPFVVLLLFSSAVHFSKAASAAYEAADGSGGLTEAEFAAGDLINDEELVRMYPGFGGPKMAPRDSEAGNFSIPKGGAWAIWTKGEIPYTISSGFSGTDRAVIARAFKYLMDRTCLRFYPAPSKRHKPRMDFIADNLGGYCYTWWTFGGDGHATAEVHLSPSSSCTVTRTVLHEILHGLTFYHVHKRSDRDRYININWDNVNPNLHNEFNFCTGCCCETWGTSYDCSSVMHYARDQMSINGGDTMVSKTRRCRLLPFIRWNVHTPYLSRGDFEILDTQYGDFC